MRRRLVRRASLLCLAAVTIGACADPTATPAPVDASAQDASESTSTTHRVGLAPGAPEGHVTSHVDESHEPRFDDAHAARERIDASRWAGTSAEVFGPTAGDDISADPVSQARRDAAVQVYRAGGGLPCTGTLITPRIVMTAAHCVDQAGGYPTRITVGATLLTGTDVRVVGCFMHNSYSDLVAGIPAPPSDTPFTPEFERCGHATQDALMRTRHDLAVLILEERIERGRAGTVEVIPARADFTHVPGGTTVRVAGYAAADGSVRRTATDTLEGYMDASLFLHEGAMFFTDSTNPGDSGGPIFLGDADSGPLRWVGSVFGGNWLNRTYCPPAGNSANAAFVRQFLDGVLDGKVDLPPDLPAPVFAGDWDLPLRGESDRFAAPLALRELDRDGDGLVAAHDNCPWIYNPEQRDGAIGAAGTGVVSAVDVELDGVANFADCLGRIIPVIL